MPVIVIDDADDPRLSDYVGLSDPELRRRVESDRGFFVAESPHVVEALLRSSRRVRSVLVTPIQRDALAGVLDGADAPVYVARPEVLREVVGFDLHRGAVASGDRWHCRPSAPCSPARGGSRSWSA
jgi:tRNA G18 (ribose-2'-O)-methylase SpoU